MLEPSVTQTPVVSAASAGGAARLVRAVRDAQRADYWSTGIALGITALVAGLCGAVFLANVSITAAHGLVTAGVLSAIGLALVFGVWLSNRRVGSDERTALALADVAPALRLDLLAAVELSKAVGTRDDFSPELARAFIADVDARASRESVANLLDRRPARWAWATMTLTWLAAIGCAVGFSTRFNQGLAHLVAGTPVVALQRKAITGDVTVTYRYPAYTGLEARTVTGTTGELSGPAGTEVLLETRADRDVDAAALEVNGTRVALTVKGRELSGGFTLEKPGQYHVVFLDGRRLAAEGPDLAIHVEADTAPDVRLTSPQNELEVDDVKGKLLVGFNVSDDYGLTGLALVYRVQGKPEQRLKLRSDDGRTMRSDYAWDIGALNLKPGASVSYFLEATDNDTIAGPKKGVSRTQVFTLYSAAAHQREALAKAQALWERLVVHLADRLESPERKTPLDATSTGITIDDRAKVIAAEMQAFAKDTLAERDPVPFIPEAFALAGQELASDTRIINARRRPGARLQALVQNDVLHSERNVLYLETLLDGQKLQALRDMAQELRDERRELSSLIEEFSKTKDPALQQQLISEMERLRTKMQELQQRMAELSRGIRDEFMNEDALKELMSEENLDTSLDEVEKLVREGNADEAMKKMQELAMQMDEMLESLENAADKAEEESDPELTRMFEAFQKDLDATVEEQEAVAKKTQALRDKARQAAKARIEKEGQALKRELLKDLESLEQSYDALGKEQRSPGFDEQRERATRDVDATKQALESNEFSLANDAAQSLEEQAQGLAQMAENQRAYDEELGASPERKRQGKQLSERMARDAQKASEVARKLEKLFPQGSQGLSEADKQELGEQAKQQKGLGDKARDLQQQMEQIGERAPVFDEEAKQQLDEAGQHMQSAAQGLNGKDPNKGSGEQQGALQALKGLQGQLQQMQQGGQGSGGKGMPKPVMKMSGRGRSGGGSQRVEIPDEDPNKAARELRQDVMDAMKQGAPDRYRDQNKKYYEELVK